MKKIFLKLFLVSLPILFILTVYVVTDPFKVLYHYSSYFPAYGVQPVVLNKDYVSTETFINNYPVYHYDSYIFGNSRSMYYHVDEWEKHINSDKCFHFDASNESLYGIERKLAFIDSRHIPIKNVLIILDETICSTTTNIGEAHLFKKHPALSGQSTLDFQSECLKAFFDVDFLSTYMRFLVTHKATESDMKKLLLTDVPEKYDVATNENSFPAYEQQIARNRDSFYTPRMSLFYKRDSIQQYSQQTIKADQIKLFNNIKSTLTRNGCSYRIVISPEYNQFKFNVADLALLQSMFGKENVFDFSGIKNITNDVYNYYESSHYRPAIANMIMDSIYTKK